MVQVHHTQDTPSKEGLRKEVKEKEIKEKEVKEKEVKEKPENLNFTELPPDPVSGIKVYKCNICNVEFKLPGHVKAHITKSHVNKKDVPTSGVQESKKRKNETEEDNENKKAKAAHKDNELGFNSSMVKDFDATFEFSTSTQNSEGLESLDDILAEYEAKEDEITEETVQDSTVVEMTDEKTTENMIKKIEELQTAMLQEQENVAGLEKKL